MTQSNTALHIASKVISGIVLLYFVSVLLDYLMVKTYDNVIVKEVTVYEIYTGRHRVHTGYQMEIESDEVDFTYKSPKYIAAINDTFTVCITPLFNTLIYTLLYQNGIPKKIGPTSNLYQSGLLFLPFIMCGIAILIFFIKNNDLRFRLSIFALLLAGLVAFVMNAGIYD